MRRWFRRYLMSMLEDDWGEGMSLKKKEPARLPLLPRKCGRPSAQAKAGAADLAGLAQKKSSTDS